MKILLVEDARAVAALMAARLAAFGYEVLVANNGKEAVDRFLDVAPDLVLMDIEMPVMNGFEATNRIRALESAQAWAWTPIIFLTASDTPENMVTAIEAGGDDFLSKTVPEAVLQAKMKALSRVAALRNRLARANRQLAEMASRDGLTGIYNRRHMDLLADQAWEESVRGQRPFGLLMLDVDNFKRYNDHYGHQAGDDCLRAVASAVAGVVAAGGDLLRREAITARYGGEEFAVIIPDAERFICEALAGRILDAIRGLAIPHERNAEWGCVTASIGGAWLAEAGGRIGELFCAADANLYRAKDGGRNRFAFE